MAKLRVLGVGAGFFSQFQYLGWRNIADVNCVAIVNRDQAKARALAERYGIPEVHGDLDAALDAVKPDLVDLITPPETHRAFVAKTIARGIPTICQKPFGTSYADATAIAEMADRARVPLVIHENFRWEPWYREAKRLIDARTLGALHSIAFRLRPGDGQGPRAYLDRQPYFQQMPRFLVTETAIHWIDTFRFLMGEVAAVYARLRRINPAIAGEDAGYVVFEYEGGATGLFDGNRLNDHVADNPRRTMGEAWIEGSAGVLRLDGDARLWWKPHQQAESVHAYDRGPDDTFGGGACEWLQRHVVAHLLAGAPLENTARDYLANLRVQEAIYRSAAEGRRIELASFDPLQPEMVGAGAVLA
ncbi:MAG: Gfo/Idh/MocA family oxidoreductase [Pseudomonadota bacterium]|nr:Gfo/Idh/MocA family oxidoreductase [Pseudomonadota bacterium]